MAKRRANGEGSIRKRSDGRWEGRIVVGHKENGDSIFRYIYADTQKELTTKLRQNIDAYRGIDLTEQSKVCLSEWLDQWLDERMRGTIRSHTLEGYQRNINNHVNPYLGQKQLSKITPSDLNDLYTFLLEQGRIIKRQNCARGLAPATVRGIHTILHHALTEEGLIPSNPASKVVPPKIANRSKGILNNEQLDTLMEAIAKDELWHDFFYTELTTGLRRGELCSLKWEDFDSKAGTLKICRTIRSGKGGTLEAGDTKTYAGKRTILLPHSTVQLLKKRKESALTEWIFPDLLNPEKPTHPAGAYRQLKKILTEARLPSIRFHDLRHTFATNALEHGMDIKTLSTVIGHVSSATTLNVYAHVTDEMRQSAAAKIDRAIARVESQPEPAIPKKPARSNFQAVKPGTGCVTQISDHLWEGRYSPKVNGKRMARNIYAPTEEECEEKLAQLIVQMKAEIADLRAQAKAG